MHLNVLSPYVNILNRLPDREAYFHMANMKQEHIEEKLIQSEEFLKQKISVINFLYLMYLGRVPDESGYETYKHFSFLKLKYILLNSNEFKERLKKLKVQIKEKYDLQLEDSQNFRNILITFGNKNISIQIKTKYIYLCSESIYKYMTFLNYELYTDLELKPPLLEAKEITIYRSKKHEFNPSIVYFNGKYVWAARRIIHKTKPVVWSNIDTDNSHCCGELTIYEENKVVFNEVCNTGCFFMNGYEDVKLCVNKTELYALVNFRNKDNIFKYVLFIFDDMYNIKIQKQLYVDDAKIECLDQKNWNMYFETCRH